MILADLCERLKREGTLVLSLKVIPKASRNEVASVMEDGVLKLKVTAAPEKGKANEAVCELLAKEFGVARKNVQILRGETSHTKQVRITE